jgi:hypothetical protein
MFAWVTFVTEDTFTNAAGILPWLQDAIAHFYPDSTYAKSLNEEVRQLAAQASSGRPEPVCVCNARAAARPTRPRPALWN